MVHASSLKSRRASLGVVAYCFGIARAAHGQVPGVPDFANPAVFIQEAARMGASAAQLSFGVLDGASVRRIREISEAAGVTLEGIVSIPKADADLPRFEAELKTLRELGVKIARTVLFPGRRYEQFKSQSDFREAVKQAFQSARISEPVAVRNKVRLAIENHKDQRTVERLELLEHFHSEYLGACVDIGNNLALLENVLEFARAFAPWALTVHFKDQGVSAHEEGFLLADVILGQGCIDLPAVIKIIREKQPGVIFQLELITRDPLKVPVLTERYWTTFDDLPARDLAETWRLVKRHGASKPFPLISGLPRREQVQAERRNIEESFKFAIENLGLSA